MRFKNISEKVIEYVITRNTKELAQLTRYKIADEFGINKNYLSEKFKEETEMTVLQFLDFEKMKRAELLLKIRSDLSVEKISHALGIENLTQFRSKFKRVFGLKPGYYRKVLKNCPFRSFFSSNGSIKLLFRKKQQEQTVKLKLNELKSERKYNETRQ